VPDAVRDAVGQVLTTLTSLRDHAKKARGEARDPIVAELRSLTPSSARASGRRRRLTCWRPSSATPLRTWRRFATGCRPIWQGHGGLPSTGSCAIAGPAHPGSSEARDGTDSWTVRRRRPHARATRGPDRARGGRDSGRACASASSASRATSRSPPR
jgi:hypothetical protein